MGAWGIATFENDDAEDWVEELTLNDDATILCSALDMIRDGYLEWPDACNALAAAEVIAALQGLPRDNLPIEVAKWVNAHTNQDVAPLVSKAIYAVDRIKSDECELCRLWRNSNYYGNWLADVDKLRTVLLQAA